MFLNANTSAELVDADQGDDGADDLDVLPVAQPRVEPPLVPSPSKAARPVHDCVDDLNRTPRQASDARVCPLECTGRESRLLFAAVRTVTSRPCFPRDINPLSTRPPGPR